MVGFDVLNEPWIPVAALDGTSRELGILGVLSEAHRLSEVICESPLETYAVQRFLIAFLMDAYRLPHASDRKKLLENGCFDRKVISDYVELCRSEGVTFDLFDEKRPFYQASFDERYDSETKIKPIANLFHSVPSGNTPVHFEHGDLYECSPAQALRALLAAQIFAAAMTQGYPSSVNDTPCWYVLLKGENLFETLCMSMLSVGECRGIEFDSAYPAWRDTTVEIPKAEHADISMLEGLTFRPRRVTLIQDPDNMVRKLYYQQGQSFHQNGRWIDPHVTFSVNKAGEYISVKPKLGRMPWRDVGSFMLSKEDKLSRPAKIITASERIVGKHTSRLIMLYGLVTNQAKYEDWMSDHMNVPGDLLFDEDKADSIRAAINRAERAAVLVYSTVNGASNATEHTKDGKKKQSEAAKEAETVFFAEMHTALFAEYFPVLAEADTMAADWENGPNNVANALIEKTARQTTEDFVKKLGTTAKCLEVQTEMLRFFRNELKRILYGRKVDG